MSPGKKVPRLFFDANDHKLLAIVNDVLRRKSRPQSLSSLMAPYMHPRGIKEMAAPSGLRIAYAIVGLLGSLEAGKAHDRIVALRCLRDEVFSSSTTYFQKNTARVLMQIMKELVRSRGNELRQLKLAHDFRMVYTGRPRLVKAELARYHLLEMPEEWNQFAFDDHVHDANTKGRKSPTHLLMDAWIKGIRKLTVVYYNHVDEEVVAELLEAGSILDIHVRIGIELWSQFRASSSASSGNWRGSSTTTTCSASSANPGAGAPGGGAGGVPLPAALCARGAGRVQPAPPAGARRGTGGAQPGTDRGRLPPLRGHRPAVAPAPRQKHPGSVPGAARGRGGTDPPGPFERSGPAGAGAGRLRRQDGESRPGGNHRPLPAALLQPRAARPHGSARRGHAAAAPHRAAGPARSAGGHALGLPLHPQPEQPDHPGYPGAPVPLRGPHHPRRGLQPQGRGPRHDRPGRGPGQRLCRRRGGHHQPGAQLPADQHAAEGAQRGQRHHPEAGDPLDHLGV